MANSDRRVAVTGIGLVTALGHDVGDFWKNCLEGKTAVCSVPNNWQLYYEAKSSHWSPLSLPDFGAIGLRRSEVLSYDVAALNSLYAAEHALSSAHCVKSVVDEKVGRYRLDAFDTYRCAAFIGTGLGCITSTFQNHIPHLLGRLGTALRDAHPASAYIDIIEEVRESLLEAPRVLPIASIKCMANSISSLLSLRYGLRAANETSIAACAAGSVAIARAYEQISRGKIDFALAGGTEYYGDRAGAVFMAFDRLNTLAKSRPQDDAINRPFDIDRTGFLYSQGGACILALEDMDSARARGASVLAELRGAFSTSDAYSLAALEPDGLSIQRMMKGSLLEADVSASDIKYINTHGTGTVQNDELEAALIEKLFPNRPILNSTKSLLGHTIGACGAIESAVTVLSIATGEVHPTINLDSPIRDLNFAVRRQTAKISCALTQNFGFGGHNVGLVFAKP